MDADNQTHWIMVSGYAGSGKTTCSELLSKRTGFPVLDKDVLTEEFSDALLEECGSQAGDRNSGVYLEKVRPLEYSALDNAVWDNLANGVSVISVAPYIKEFDDDYFWEEQQEKCEEHGVKMHVIWVHATIDDMEVRVIFRDSPRDKHKIDNWVDYAISLEEYIGHEHTDYIIDNGHIDSLPSQVD